MTVQALFIALPFVFAALLAAIFFPAARLRVRAQALWSALFVFCAAKFLVFQYVGGNAFAPELPEKLIWFWNWAYSGMCIFLAFAMAARIARLAARTVPPLRRIPAAPRAFRLVFLPLFAWAVAAKGVYNGVKLPDVKEIVIEYPGLHPSLDGYRIVHATDIHASAASRRWRTQAIVDAVNALDADIVCLTGDYSDGKCAARCGCVAPLGSLKARDGVFAVTGNHEYYYDTAAWFAFYHSIGIDFIDGECVRPRAHLAVAGVADPACIRAGIPPPATAALFNSATNGEFRILLQHRPHIGEPSQFARCDLQLSGHTHGGVAPLMDSLVAYFNGGMSKGLYAGADGRKIYVSSGAGQWAGFPVRYFDDPEIVLITLRAAKGAVGAKGGEGE